MNELINKRNPSGINRLLIHGLYISALLYNIHRYIFKYNSSATSPTYTNTPNAWKAGKYLIILLVLSFFYMNKRAYKIHQPVRELIIHSFLLWSLVVNVIWILDFGTPVWEELEYLLWGIALLPVFYLGDDLKEFITDFLSRNFSVIAYFTIVTDFFVIANYHLTGRLTALSYEGSLIRFGGLWDDPNGFGLFCNFLVYIALDKRKWLMAALLAICVFYTVSFSAYLIFFIVILLWGLKGFRINNYFLYFSLAAGTGICLIFALYWPDIYAFYVTTVQQKQGSIDSHTSVKLEFLLFPYLNKKFFFHETWYISYLYNYSPFSYLFLFLILCFVIYLFSKPYKAYTEIYLLLFMLEMIFIPMLSVFPLNMLFFLFLYSTYGIRYKKKEGG
ncbi:hypothetical protein [Compostibacter hankyongensis]|uniref:EpsG family protein n=1 Tax=Compostibacter hankyongensis TaxID=1007089 RepID=A0ABP8G866_9BACT